jgi:hypothetical protein
MSLVELKNTHESGVRPLGLIHYWGHQTLNRDRPKVECNNKSILFFARYEFLFLHFIVAFQKDTESISSYPLFLHFSGVPQGERIYPLERKDRHELE